MLAGILLSTGAIVSITFKKIKLVPTFPHASVAVQVQSKSFTKPLDLQLPSINKLSVKTAVNVCFELSVTDTQLESIRGKLSQETVSVSPLNKPAISGLTN